mmetsp:Transcript_48711/g.72318  ORF Transcript_48711/g.72318 Transcript_48711/m.72318 type:complete len:460 (-) Transcript_48711:364-1743(-)
MEAGQGLVSVRYVKICAFLGLFSGTLSVMSSSSIICTILLNRRRKFRLVYHRLVFSMSIMDILVSCAHALSTAALPVGTPGSWGAIGNDATCTMQGFLTQTGVAVPMLNGMLSMYYLLTIRYGIRENFIRNHIEPFMHAIPILYAFTTASLGLALNLYSPVEFNTFCWISTVSCENSVAVGCTRNSQAIMTRRFFYGAVVSFNFIFIPVVMVAVYWTVSRQEQLLRNRHRDSITVVSCNRSRKVAHQGMAYVAAFYMTYAWGVTLHGVNDHKGVIVVPLIFMTRFFAPLQGFFNYIIYIRPSFLNVRKENPDKSFFWTLGRATFSQRKRGSYHLPDLDRVNRRPSIPVICDIENTNIIQRSDTPKASTPSNSLTELRKLADDDSEIIEQDQIPSGGTTVLRSHSIESIKSLVIDMYDVKGGEPCNFIDIPLAQTDGSAAMVSSTTILHTQETWIHCMMA